MSFAPINMSSVTSAGPLPGASPNAGGHDRHQAVLEMRRAMQSGDLEAVKSAFAKFEEAMPDKRAAKTDGAIAQLRQALANGDMEGARSVMQAAVVESRGSANKAGNTHSTNPAETDWPVPPPNDWNVPQGGSAGGVPLGSVVNITA
jgi:hypothetical protein